MKLDIIDIIGIITVFLLLIFSLVLLKYEKGNKLSNKLLAAFLFSNAIYILNYLIVRNQVYFVNNISFLFYIGGSAGFLFGPLIYLYTRSLTDPEFKFTRITLFHFIPFSVVLIYILINFQFQSSNDLIEIIIRNEYFSFRFFTVITILMNVQIFIYLFASLTEIKKYRYRLKSYFSSIEKINLNWLGIIIIAFVMMWFVDLIHFILASLEIGPYFNYEYLTIISLLINLIFATYIIFKGLEHPDFISGFIESKSKVKYSSSKLTDKEKEEYQKKIENYLKKEKPYLSPALSIEELSNQVNIPKRHLSQIINESYNKNFYDFINSFRVEETKRYLSDPEDNRTILEILYDSGFNSKSVFNRIFKDSTGKTPSEFRKEYNFETK